MLSALLRTLLPCLIIFTSVLSAKNSFIDIEDQNKLEFRSPTLSTRKTAKIQLSNGIKVYIISDEKADQSGAAIAVMSGSWSEPKQYPGIAHFLEHMLFKGTAAYPEEEGFMKFIWDNGGSPNAFTADDKTVYMYSINNNAFTESLDRFSHFFIDPLFAESAIERELFAVDQEYAQNIENDAWRKYQISKETGNPLHPNHCFSIGNSSKKGRTSSGGIVFCPLGLLISEAILATNLFTDIPAEACNSSSSKIRCRISFAIKLADGFPFLFSVTSK